MILVEQYCVGIPSIINIGWDNDLVLIQCLTINLIMMTPIYDMWSIAPSLTPLRYESDNIPVLGGDIKAPFVNFFVKEFCIFLRKNLSGCLTHLHI